MRSFFIMGEISFQTKSHVVSWTTEAMDSTHYYLCEVKPVSVSVSAGVCVNDCKGKPNGNYQSCKGCSGFVTCANEILYEQSCAGNLVWDDRKKTCAEKSGTCSTTISEGKDYLL